MPISNAEIEKQLEELPDKVADALLVWRKCTIERETVEARLFVEKKKFALSGGGPAGDDYIKSLVRSEDSRRDACECEAAAEAMHQRLYERLMGAKRSAAVRAAF
jgi:hypothetical protein